MSFEQMLRERIQREADAIPLPMRTPDQAIDRSGSYRRRQVVRATAAGLTVAVVAAVVGTSLMRDGDRPDSVASGSAAGLVPTGPLELDWRAAEGGLSNVRASFQADDGTIYALSTGPGARDEDHPEGDTPRALYRLSEDGTWEPLSLDGERPRAVDVASGGGLLYAVSTGPASGGGTTVHLSTSGDGGETWSAQEVGSVEPPSTAVQWNQEWSMSVESNGSTTLALASTSFYPDVAELFPEMGDDDSLAVETRDEGLVLVSYENVEVDEAGGLATTPPTAPDAEARAEAEARGEAEAESEPEVVRTVTWADLGVTGPEAFHTRVQLFRGVDGGWEPIDGGGEALAGLSGGELQVSGERFVASGWAAGNDEAVAFTSTDGTSWAPVPVSEDYNGVVSVGSALVQLPFDGTILRVSGDGGATWHDVDLAEAGVPEGAIVTSYDAGPLGIALVVNDSSSFDNPQLVVSGDLIDWTVTPLADIVGMEALGGTTVVGEDRIVVSVTEPATSESDEIPRSVTVVGTPVR